MGLLKFEFKAVQDTLSRTTLVRRVNLYFKQAAKITRRTVAAYINNQTLVQVTSNPHKSSYKRIARPQAGVASPRQNNLTIELTGPLQS